MAARTGGQDAIAMGILLLLLISLLLGTALGAWKARGAPGRGGRMAAGDEGVTGRTQADETARLLIEERAARAAAEQSEKRARFLADASATLASALEVEAAFRHLARLAVPSLADWCLIDMVEGERTRRIASAHRHPAKNRALHELERRCPPQRDAASRIAGVIRSGRPELVAQVRPGTDDVLAQDAHHRELARTLRPKSYAIVPFVARDRTLGAMTVATSESGRRYQAPDLALAQDLASRAALAADNARLYQQALAASRAKSDFLAVMSHELRTPLTAISGYADLVGDGIAGPVTDHQREMLGRITANAHKQLGIIDDILQYSRLDTGRERVAIEPVDLALTLHEQAEAIRPEAAKKGLAVELRLPPGPMPAETDGEKVRHILADLLDNAVKFTSEGTVTLDARVQDGTIRLRVGDTGIGIPTHSYERVFEPFAQIEDALTRETGGTGLGLAVARRLARLLGGDIQVESGPGRGSTFEVTIPVKPPRRG